jgi:hypothetical protein
MVAFRRKKNANGSLSTFPVDSKSRSALIAEITRSLDEARAAHDAEVILAARRVDEAALRANARRLDIDRLSEMLRGVEAIRSQLDADDPRFSGYDSEYSRLSDELADAQLRWEDAVDEYKSRETEAGQTRFNAMKSHVLSRPSENYEAPQ